MATTNWTGKAGDQNFNTAGNWDNGIPTALEGAIIVGTVGTSLEVFYASGTDSIQSLTAEFATLAVSGGTLTILSEATLEGDLIQTGGVLALDEIATVAGDFYQTNGTISIAADGTLWVSGAAQFGPYGTGQINGAGTFSATGTTAIDEALYLGGGLDWINSGVVNDDSSIYGGDVSGGTATLTNLAGASFNLTGDYLSIADATYSDSAGSHTGSLTFINQGTLAKTGGNGTSNISTPVTDTGTITSDSGVLEFDGGGTFSGVMNGAGYVAFGGGTSTLGGTAGLIAVNLEVDGGTVLLANVRTPISGILYQTTGTVVIASGDTLAVSGAAQFGPYGTGQINGAGTFSATGTTAIDEALYLGGGLDWINSGVVNDDSSIYGGDVSGGTATLTNLAGANFNLTGDYLSIADATYSDSAGSHTGSLTFINQGTLAKTGGTGTSNISTPITDTGTITSDSGVLEFDGGGTFSGVMNGAGYVAFGGGTSTLGGTAGLIAVNLEVDGGTVLLANVRTPISGILYQTTGTVVIASGDTLAVSGAAQFGPYGTGQINGAGTFSTTGSTAIDEALYLGGGLDWINSGVVNDDSSLYGGDISGGTATLTNLAGASFNLTGDYLSIADASYSDSAGSHTGSLTFINQGTLAKTAGTGTSNISTPVTDTGTITSDSGVLEFDGGGTFSGVMNGAGYVAFGRGTSTLGGTAGLSAVNLEVDGGTVLLASVRTPIPGIFYQTTGTVVIASGDTLAVSGAAQFGPYGTGQINGAGTFSTTGSTAIDEALYLGGGLDWINSGVVNDDSSLYDGDISGGTATLTNLAGASFNLTGDYLSIADASYSDSAGSHTGSLTFINQGTLAKTAGTGTSNISTPVTDTGTITSDSGVLEFDGGGTFSGVMNGAGYVAFGGGTSTLGGTAGLTAVNLEFDGGTAFLSSVQLPVSGRYYQTSGTVVIASGESISIAAFYQQSGTVSLASGDTLAVAGAAQFGPYGSGQFNGPGTFSTPAITSIEENVAFGGGLDWTNSGDVNDDSSIYGGDISGGTATLTNLAGANFNLTGDYLSIADAIYSDSAGSHTGSLTFINQGTLAKTAGTGTSNISTPVTDTGTITSDSGVLEFDGGGTFSGVMNGAGYVAFGGGTSTLGGTAGLTAVNLEFDGGTAFLSGVRFPVSGRYYQTSGTVVIASGESISIAAFYQQSGTVSLASGDTLAVSGAAQFGPYGTGQFNGPGTFSTSGATAIDEAIVLGGDLSWINSGIVNDDSNIYGGDVSGGAATLTNLAGASFDLTGDYLGIADATYTDSVGSHTGSLTFINQGTLAKTTGTGTSSITTAVTNAGLIAAMDGTFLFSGAVNNLGSIEAEPLAAVDIAGTLTGNGDVVVDGGGEVEISLASNATILFTGAGTLDLASPDNFTGTISGMRAGSEIIFGGNRATSISVANAVVTVDIADGTSFHLAIANALSAADFTLSGNTLTATSTLGPPVPDLIVSGVSVAAEVLAGLLIPITWTDSNQGNLSATGPWTDEVFLASDASGDNPQLLGTLTVNAALEPNGTLDQTLDVTIPAAISGNEWILVKTDARNQVIADGTGPEREGISSAANVIYTAVAPPALSLSAITPDDGSNLGSVTVTIKGAQFNADEQVEIIAPSGTITEAGDVRFVNSGELWATFNLTGLPLGAYNVAVTDGTRSGTLDGAFVVNNGPIGSLSVSLALPLTTTLGDSGTATVYYANTGDTDLDAPLLDVDSAQALLQTSASIAGSSDIEFLATDPNGPAGILPPGATGSVSFTYTPTGTTVAQGATIEVGSIEAGTTIDWGTLESALQPPTVDATDWNNVWTVFVDEVGDTTDSLAAVLAADATELSQVGDPTNDVATLLEFQLLQASGALGAGYLTEATDITADTSSLSLSLERFYDGTLLGRDAAGAFGDGWTFTYAVTATADGSGNVTIQSPGTLHVFTLQANGTFVAQPGDTASLTESGGLYKMTDGGGNVEKFLADGKLGSVTDTNGNTVTLSYGVNGVLAKVTNQTTGETITFTSNAAGRITSAADSNGQTTAYAYDSTSTLLLSATGPAGTTTYTYTPATGSVNDNALTAITGPNGTSQAFTYDAEGRLASELGGGASDAQTFSYGAGSVTITDALGNAGTLLYDASGNVAQEQDPLGNATLLQSTATGELTGITTAGNDTSTYGYDAGGNLTSNTDPLGGTVSATYAPGTQELTSLTNQRDSTINYTYNAAGDVTGITYQDGSGGTYGYNTSGLLISSKDADGNTTLYSYDSVGDVTGKTFSDGTSDTYAYNAQGDLIAATARDGGKTTYTYDAANRLTGVTNPQGQVETYTYNVDGELATRTEPDGSVTQYLYDSAGRLSKLEDGSGNLLDKYTYNAAGELARTDTGNGADTTYQYDADGNVTEILNSNADGSVASQYDYGYDANGQVVEEATTDGVWNYSYDAEGELAQAVFVSVNPAIQNQNISYVYDAAGNRVSQTVNGVVTDYTTNALNQYVAVGGTTYTYNADGDMASEVDSAGTTTFAYDDNNQLISETGPGGSYQYAYDALANLVSTTANGTITDYVNDPLSLSVGDLPLTSIAQSYNSDGLLKDTYDYGLGLDAVSDTTGSTSYFDSDSNGNVIGISGSAGTIVSSYFYSPFGVAQQITGTLDNPFEFGGAAGIPTLSNGLQVMRARTYDSKLGRFTTEDPTGIDGGANLYAYALNDPVQLSDPAGEFVVVLVPVVIILGGGLVEAGSKYIGSGGQASWGDLISAFAGGAAAGGTLFFTKSPILAASADIAASNAVAGIWYHFSGQEFEPLDAAFDGAITLLTAGPAGALEKTAVKNFLTGYWKNVSSKTLGKIFSGIVDDQLKSLKLQVIKKVTELLYSASKTTASLYPDPHLETFDGLYYSFQTAGEFVLTRDTDGGTFQVQARLSAPSGATSYSVITELGIQVGSAQRVTIDSTRANAVEVNGAPVTFTTGLYTLTDGVIIQTVNGYQVELDTGETVTATINSPGTQDGPGTTSGGLTTSISLSPTAPRGSVQGLMGNYNGTASQDLSLPDGTVLPSDMPLSELYGTYASAWRVTDATSLLDYGPGQTTATFTDVNYPGSQVTLASYPTAAIQTAESLVTQAGITDPGLQQAAVYDYLVTGDANTLNVEANLQQTGVTTTAMGSFVAPAAPPEVGIIANQASIVLSAAGSATADFQIYYTGDTSAPATVNYAVVTPDSDDLGASALGGTLATDTVTFAAGQTLAMVSISVPQGIGYVPSAVLDVQITAASTIDVIGGNAEEQIVNNAPVAGPPPGYAFELINDLSATPTITGNVWNFDLGALSQNTSGGEVELAVVNVGSIGADDLGGTITAAGNGTVATNFLPDFNDLSPGAVLDLAALAFNPSGIGTETETLTLSPTDSNASGYLASLPVQTVTVEATACYAAGTRIAVPNGERPVEELAEGDTVLLAAGGSARILWLGHRAIDCRRHPRPADVWPVRVFAGAFGRARPVRDLLLSPDHAVFVDGVLIPVRYLINHATIIQQAVENITYWHVELERHDVILAEGLPCESYLDTGNRQAFANGGRGVQLQADFAYGECGEAIWEAAACAPLRIEGAAVVRVVALLRQQAEKLGHPVARRKRQRPARTEMMTADLARLLQPEWYLSVNLDVATRGMDAAAHYASSGRREGRLPCPAVDLVLSLGLIDPSTIAVGMSDVVAAGAGPVKHFCAVGWQERRRPNAYFETSWYLETYDVPDGMNPLLHYVLLGEGQGLQPSPHFDPIWYRQRYVLGPSESALAHYLKHRRTQRFSPLPTFDLDAYKVEHAETLLPNRDPYAHYLAIGRFAEAGIERAGRIAA